MTWDTRIQTKPLVQSVRVSTQKETTKTVSQLQSLKTTEMTLSTTSCRLAGQMDERVPSHGTTRSLNVEKTSCRHEKPNCKRKRQGWGHQCRGSCRLVNSWPMGEVRFLAYLSALFPLLMFTVQHTEMSATPTITFIHLPLSLPLTDTFKCNFLVIRNYVILARMRAEKPVTRTTQETSGPAEIEERIVTSASSCIQTWHVATLGRPTCASQQSTRCWHVVTEATALVGRRSIYSCICGCQLVCPEWPKQQHLFWSVDQKCRLPNE